jgi:hypothetical protein
MFPKTLFATIAILALVSMACGITINLPVRDVKVGPTVVEQIDIPMTEGGGDPVRVTLGFGAGELNISPGATDAVVQGEATYNVEDLKPEITIRSNEVLLETGDLDLEGIPSFGDELKNIWDLRLGDAPLDLRINAGAYKGEFDLGGLSIQDLRISDGASDVNVNFSAPNRVAMESLRYNTGASQVKLTGLANANFEEMVFKGGAGDYTLDFSGELMRDATVTVDSGFCNVTIIVPQGISARIFVDSGLVNVDISGNWEKSGNEYTLDGEGPRLTINANIGAGSLNLRNR